MVQLCFEKLNIYINCAHKWKPSNKCSSLAFCSQNDPTPNQNRIFELSLRVWHTKVATIIPLLILPLFCCYQDCFPYHCPFSLLLLKRGHGMSGDFNWYCADNGKTSTDKALSLGLNLRTVKLCYSESGRPRHIFSLLPSSRYSQMTNLPRETKGNNLGTGAVDLRGLQCDGGCVTLGLRAGRERQRHHAHSSQTKMSGGRGRGGYTPHKDAPFVVFLCYRPPRDVPYRELDNKVGVGRVARTFVNRKDKKSLVITEMVIH